MTHIQNNSGGPAFPTASTEHSCGDDGMSLRDWFAGMALSGMQSGYWANAEMSGVSPDMFARDAYQQADAMLGERKK